MTGSRYRVLTTTAAALSAVAALVVVPGAAVADPIGDARARAATLARTVDRLETRAEIAIEAYNAVQERLGRAVVRQSLAERQAEADAGQVDVAARQVEERVRALYAAGGRASLLVTVLDGNDPVEAMAGLHYVGAVLEVSQDDLAAARQVSDAAADIAGRLTDAATRVTELQQEASRAAEQVRGLLARHQAALDTATGEVRRLMEQRRAALAAASAQQFLAAAGGSFPPGTTAPNAVAAAALAAARSRLGVPYVWGATGPDSFDCSGLTQWAYAHAGVGLPRVAADQWNAGPHVAIDALLPGDLLFWASDVNDPRTIHHEAMYIGDGMMLAAPHTGDVVKIQPVYLSGYIGATRPYAASS